MGGGVTVVLVSGIRANNDRAVCRRVARRRHRRLTCAGRRTRKWRAARLFDRGMTIPRDRLARRPTSAQLLAARDKTVRDVIAPDLDVLFVGINPGLYTAAV